MPIADDLYVYQTADDRVVRLTDAPAEKSIRRSVPTETRRVRSRQQPVRRRHRDRRESALTTDGAPKILNGKLDWVYEEEIYGRGQSRGYWWSPDSSRLAFLRIDDTPVPRSSPSTTFRTSQNVETWDYPKAGDPNPLVRLGVARAAGGPPTWIDTSKYPATDPLIVRVGWTPDSRKRRRTRCRTARRRGSI